MAQSWFSEHIISYLIISDHINIISYYVIEKLQTFTLAFGSWWEPHTSLAQEGHLSLFLEWLVNFWASCSKVCIQGEYIFCSLYYNGSWLGFFSLRNLCYLKQTNFCSSLTMTFLLVHCASCWLWLHALQGAQWVTGLPCGHEQGWELTSWIKPGAWRTGRHEKGSLKLCRNSGWKGREN